MDEPGTVIMAKYGRCSPVTVKPDRQRSEVRLVSAGQTIILDYSQICSLAQDLSYLMMSLPLPGLKPEIDS